MFSPDHSPVSVLVPTYNCEKTLAATLQSAAWADELLVVDSFSDDGTLDLCRQFGARIIQHKYETPARQKNWAIPHCQYDWVLQLDSDEILEDGLVDEIKLAIQQAPEALQAFRLPRKNHVLGVWVPYAGIYPDYQTRLFRRAHGRFVDRYVHEHLSVPGEVESLRGHILHYGMESISKQLGNLDRYTRYEANELYRQGRRFSATGLLLRPWLTFTQRYLWQQGYRAGWRGFLVCAHAAIYQFFTYAKLWELKEAQLEHSPD